MNTKTMFVVVFLLISSLCFGQVSTGSVAGTVTDPGGAAVPNAKVVAKNVNTGVATETVTSGAGLYVFGSLQAGMYEIDVQQVGFKKLLRTGLEVRVAQRLVLDLSLEVGDVQQSVEVSAEAPLLEAQDATRGQNFSNKFMSTLPLFTGGIRNPESFTRYMPGVSSGTAETSISGSGGRAKEILIDGGSATIPESGGVSFNFPASEQFGEFKLLTGTYSAEYGRFGGGVEVFMTRSGNNGLHGGGFWNLRRDIFNAAGWSNNRTVGRTPGFRPKERFNEAGGVIGGPVFIPKVYDGRNKTFWYFTYAKDLRPASISFPVLTVPTAAMKNGDFSGSQVIYDPATTAGTVRTPFAGNLIPRARFSKVSSNVLSLIPDPNSGGLTNNYNFVNLNTVNDYHYSLKFDHSFTETNRASFYMSRQNQDSGAITNFDGPIGNGLGSSSQRPENYRVNHDLVLKPTFLIHSMFSFTRQQQGWDNPNQKGYGSKIGLPGLSGLSDAFPRVNFSGADGISAWGVQDGKVSNGTQFNWTTQITQGYTYLKGKHEFKFGWDWRNMRTFSDPLDFAGTNGQYTFNRAQTALPTALTTTGHAFASLLLGATDSANINVTPDALKLGIRYGYTAGYFNDTWKATSRLTLTLGLRYEVPIGWYEKDGNYSHVDLKTPNPAAGGLPGALLFAGYGAGRANVKRFYPTDYSDIGPRLGFAYRLTNKTVLRGGWGIYYQTLGNGGCGCRLGYGSATILYNSDGLNQALNWDGGVPRPAGFVEPPSLSSTQGLFTDVDTMSETFGKAPRIQEWSFNIQHEVSKFLIDIAYVGNRGNRLNSTVDINQLPTSRLNLGTLLGKRIDDPAVVAAGFTKPYAAFPNTQTLAQALRPYPQYLGVLSRNSGHGKTWYDALQAKLERRFGDWQLLSSYTYGKTLGANHYRQIFSQHFNVGAQDAYNLDDMKSYLPFDQPHIFNVLSSYEIPVGKGKKLLNSDSKLMNLLVGGWNVAAALQYRSGTLFQIATPGNPLGNGVLFSRLTKANTTGSAVRTGVDYSTLDPGDTSVRFFNSGTNAPFASAPLYTLGSSSLYNSAFRQPMVREENFSISKKFKWEINDTRSIDFIYRADMFNLFNRTNFGVNGAIGNSSFGAATGPQSGPRIITMGLRLDF
ncbi:MAG: carboxypeptidase regulatory-like domain-containing protein [Acidobacteriota bacterium]